ncbi:MAG: pyridoxal phosphate-dependent aminotransferase, partial [Alphaproteobacteria bacterium]
MSAVKTTAPPGRRLIDLSLNESSYGASPKAIAAAQARCASPERYPDPASAALRKALGRVHDLDPARIVCGNGSEDLLDLIGRVYARPGDEILVTEHGFAQFRLIATRVGATPVSAPENGLTADVDALLAAVTQRTKILYLANPNNPTGTYVNATELARLHSALPPSVLLVVDAAYAEYVVATDFDNGLSLARENDAENIIVTHTFSKAYGLAAFRVGWAYLPHAAAGPVNLVRAIGNVNAIAQAAALAALDDPDFVARTRDRTAEERRRLTAALTAIG